METMKAVRIHSYGGPEVLVYEDAPKPEPGEGEVLVRVHATSVNPFDWKVRRGYLAGWFNHTLPLIVGWDVAGVVTGTGPHVSGLKDGDEVYGMADASRNGAYAEYVVVKAASLTRKPGSADFVHSAAVPQAGLTAWQSLFDVAHLSTGQRVLIHAAGGGVGHFAVQFAKQRGAIVIGTCSAHNVDFVHGLGADEVINYTTSAFDEAVHDVDVVFDTVGGATHQRSYQTLKKGGTLVSVVDQPSAELAAQYAVRSMFNGAHPDTAALDQIAALIDNGKVKPTVSTVLNLHDAQSAHILSESMHTQGKIVMKVQ